VDNSQFLQVIVSPRNSPAFTVPIARWLLFNRASNALTHAYPLGRRVLIDEAAFVAGLRRKHRASSMMAGNHHSRWVRSRLAAPRFAERQNVAPPQPAANPGEPGGGSNSAHL